MWNSYSTSPPRIKVFCKLFYLKFVLLGAFFTLVFNLNSYGQKDESTSIQDTIRVRELSGPASVGNQLKSDSEARTSTWYALDSLDQAKKRFTNKTGFTIGGDYNSQIMGATKAVGNNIGASGVFRIYGKWNLVGRNTLHEGGLVFKVEHRHKYTDYPLREWGAAEVGYGGLTQSVYSDAKSMLTNLYWRQSFDNDKVVAYVGFVDITDWTDVYALASPWSSFNNLAFATTSGTMGGLYPMGTLGVMVSAWLSESIYVVGSLADVNGDPSKFYKGFDTFFNKFETVKTLELGYTPGLSTVFFQNAHVTFWQVDETDYSSSGWGLSGSLGWAVGSKWFPFLRGGWSEGGSNSFAKASLSAGIGYNIAGPNTLGIGLNWNKLNDKLFGEGLKDQMLSEIFYKWQPTHHSEITPNVQLLVNPALNPKDNFTAIFGVRARVFL